MKAGEKIAARLTKRRRRVSEDLARNSTEKLGLQTRVYSRPLDLLWQLDVMKLVDISWVRFVLLPSLRVKPGVEGGRGSVQSHELESQQLKMILIARGSRQCLERAGDEARSMAEMRRGCEGS